MSRFHPRKGWHWKTPRDVTTTSRLHESIRMARGAARKDFHFPSYLEGLKGGRRRRGGGLEEERIKEIVLSASLSRHNIHICVYILSWSICLCFSIRAIYLWGLGSLHSCLMARSFMSVSTCIMVKVMIRMNYLSIVCSTISFCHM